MEPHVSCASTARLPHFIARICAKRHRAKVKKKKAQRRLDVFRGETLTWNFLKANYGAMRAHFPSTSRAFGAIIEVIAREVPNERILNEVKRKTPKIDIKIILRRVISYDNIRTPAQVQRVANDLWKF